MTNEANGSFPDIEFEWDLGNYAKVFHAAGRNDLKPWVCEYVFKDENTLLDIPNSSENDNGEIRYLAFGYAPISSRAEFQPVAITYTYRFFKIRIISIRFAKVTKNKFRSHYENYWEKVKEKIDRAAQYS